MVKTPLSISLPGRVAQLVTCLATDASLTADSRRVVVSYKRKYVHEVLVNCLFKLAQEKCG